MFGLIRTRDIQAGDFTYGEYLQLLQVFGNEQQDDITICKRVVEILHNKRISTIRAIVLLPYCKAVNDGLVGWLQREHNECQVEPTSDQSAAGIEQLNKECGMMGSVISLAEQFGWTFEQIYALPYTDVFAINKVNAARLKFDRRMQRVMKNKR